MVLEDALNEAVPAAYETAVAEQGVTALGQPQINIDQNLDELTDGTEIVFTAEVDVRPEIELPEYKGLAVEVADVEATEADINEQLDELRGRFATVTPVERAAADGDLVVVDVTGTLDGVEVEEFSGTGMTFQVGAGNMIEALTTQSVVSRKVILRRFDTPRQRAHSRARKWSCRLRSRGCGSANCPPPTTTSPNWPLSFRRSRNCAATLPSDLPA